MFFSKAHNFLGVTLAADEAEYNRVQSVLAQRARQETQNQHIADKMSQLDAEEESEEVIHFVSTQIPTSTSTSTPTKTPVPTPTSSILRDAETLIQASTIGQPLYEWAMNNGFEIDYSDECAGHLDGKKILLNPCRPSAVYAAGQIGHEITHYILFQGNTGSQLEEYLTYMIGDAIRAELIAQGHGSGSNLDIAIPLSNYTIQLENNPNINADLEAWFESNGLGVYIRSPNEINGTPTGWGVPSLPQTFTPKP